MVSARVPAVEIESRDGLIAHLGARRTLRGVSLQSVDLSDADATLRGVDVTGTLFLGCAMSTRLEEDLTRRGALVFPRLPEVPFNPYRATLYTPAELYDGMAAGRSYAHSLDAHTWAWYRAQGSPPPIAASLAMSLHDHAISDALGDTLADLAPLVGILGGHDVQRGQAAYRHAALVALRLAQAGFTVATGGGPGAMEAANLGARFAADETALDTALARLSGQPDATSVTAWVRRGLDVARDCPDDTVSLGIPTWFYGHEPSNPFATHVAKYFSNALREDELLRTCRGGLIYLPGAAGTVQEVFQAATAGYYAAEDTATPLVLIGREYWTRTLPAWPLLSALGAHHALGRALSLVDSPEEAVACLTRPHEAPRDRP